MHSKNEIHYTLDAPLKTSRRSRGWLIVGFSLLLIFIGAYILVLTQSPNEKLPVSSSIDLNTADDKNDSRNRIQIEKMGVEVPYYNDNTPATLEKGAWWRFPERGNPVKGGNFILSAHRFYLGRTPGGTKARSPFYKLNKLEVGDKIRIFYENKWYEYEVSKKYSVKPDSTEIEAETSEPKLTLYTCSLKGSADGRTVIDATPLFDNASQTPPESGSPLL